MRENIKGVGRNGVGKLKDDSNAVLSVGSLVDRCINGWGCVRKSRCRVRM